MKLSLSAFLLAALFSVEESSASSVTTVDVKESIVTGQFFAWMEQHSKTYQTAEEAKLRLEIWNENNGACKEEDAINLVSRVACGA